MEPQSPLGAPPQAPQPPLPPGPTKPLPALVADSPVIVQGISGLPAADQVRAYIFDFVGVAFAAAAIYIGVVKGTTGADFSNFGMLAALYLGLKANPRTLV